MCPKWTIDYISLWSLVVYLQNEDPISAHYYGPKGPSKKEKFQKKITKKL